MVIMSHYYPYFASYTLISPAILQYAKYGKYGVHLFFTLSGYVIYKSIANSNSLLHFIVSRFSRLYPAYIVAVTLSYILSITIGNPVKNFIPSIADYFLNMTMFQRFFLHQSIDGVYWSLTFELMFYFYIGSMVFLGLQKNSYRYISSWMALTLVIVYALNIMHIELGELLKGLFLLQFSGYFITGMAIYNLQENSVKHHFLLIFFLSALVQYLLSGNESLIAYLAVILLFFFFYKVNVNNNFLVYVGKISYSLYLLHSLPGAVLINLLNQKINYGIYVGTIIVFMSSYVLWKYVEIPAQGLLRTWFLSKWESELVK